MIHTYKSLSSNLPIVIKIWAIVTKKMFPLFFMKIILIITMQDTFCVPFLQLIGQSALIFLMFFCGFFCLFVVVFF